MLYVIYYNTLYSKDVLSVCINTLDLPVNWTMTHLVDKFYRLIPEAIEITGLEKQL